MKPWIPRLYLLLGNIRVVALFPVRSESEGQKIQYAVRDFDPGARLRLSARGEREVVIRLPLSSYPSRRNEMNFFVPRKLRELIGNNSQPRRKIVFKMNVLEQGGLTKSNSSHNFANVVCDTEGGPLRWLFQNSEHQWHGPVAMFAGHAMAVVTANNRGWVSVNKLTLAWSDDIVTVMREELVSDEYTGPVFPAEFLEAATRAVQRANCEGCGESHFCIPFPKRQRSIESAGPFNNAPEPDQPPSPESHS